MDRSRFETMLAAPGLGLERDEDWIRASDDRPLTLLIVAGGDVVRYPKVEAIHMPNDLLDEGLIGLEREGSYAVIELTGIVSAEREVQEKESERRRTGFV